MSVPLLVLGALPGCGSNESGSRGTGGGTASSASGAGTGSGSYGETPCVRCVVGVCASEAAACDATAECKAYVDCLFACPAKNTHEVLGACADQCTEPASSSETDAFIACFKKQLDDSAGQCGAPCG